MQTYPHFEELSKLVADKQVSKRPHPSLPLFIYNYTAAAQHTPRAEWSIPLCDCRGLILDDSGVIYGRPFRKFWNYEQVLADIPSAEPFTVWEKLDGSLGIVCNYAGRRVVATRGSFESDQAKWSSDYFDKHYSDFVPEEGLTYLFEIIFPANRIVVDYGDTAAVFLLSVLRTDGTDDDGIFDTETFPKARRFDGVTDFSIVNSDPSLSGQEGFVVRWASGFRAKVKAAEYCRLHRLITQCSTRTIWELLKSGAGVQELLDRVPDDFKQWVVEQSSKITAAGHDIDQSARQLFASAPPCATRKEFAMWACQQPNQGLLFSLLDGKPISDAIWKMTEPKWATPFRKDIDG